MGPTGVTAQVTRSTATISSSTASPAVGPRIPKASTVGSTKLGGSRVAQLGSNGGTGMPGTMTPPSMAVKMDLSSLFGSGQSYILSPSAEHAHFLASQHNLAVQDSIPMGDFVLLPLPIGSAAPTPSSTTPVPTEPAGGQGEGEGGSTKTSAPENAASVVAMDVEKEEGGSV